MKIVALQENLLQTVLNASKFLPSKTAALPAVNNFYIKARKETIYIQATDLETSIGLSIPGKVEIEGEALIPAKTLGSLLSLYKGEKITIEATEKDIRLKSEKTDTVLRAFPVGDFPQTGVDEKAAQTKLSKKTLERIVKKVTFSSSGDQSRAELTGVLFEINEEGVAVVATDGFRLSRLLLQEDKKGWEKAPLISAKALRLLLDVVGESEQVSVGVDNEKNLLVAVFEDGWFATRLVQGQFPPYQKILPSGAGTTVTISRDEFMRAVRLASVFAREASNVVKLSVRGKEMVVTANAPQTGENKTTVSIKKEGEDIDIAFNYRFLLDMLSACDSDETVFEGNGPLQPGAFKEQGKTDFLHVIMPVRLQEANS